uniref:Formate dehydrogenase subunit alpha n=1 Tax=Candidatus Methanophaga sp. ANME-1 ERB7 TaxID=2759913 RepID=A0A7G9Z595_9EURY|nr:formate dehydrogenase subunit alpha [Methanosarcinales archaeon ANME-1 ERB7]
MTELEYVPTICPYCGTGCGIYLVVKDGVIEGVEPWEEHPVNEGKNCPKGRNAYEFIYGDGRLEKPLIKENGSFREATWDEALGLIADKLKGADPGSVGFINSGRTTNEDLYVLQKFARCVMKTNNMDNSSRFCHSTTVPGLLSTVGAGVMETSTISIEKADCIVLAGVNIHETYPLIGRRVKRAKERGAKVIVIDPRETVTARIYADIFLQLNPATDIALLNGLIKVIVDEGLEDKEFIESKTSGFEELSSYISKLDMSELEEISGIPRDLMKEAAEAYAKAERGCIIFNAGIAQHAQGVGNIQSLANLTMLTGNQGRPGTGVNPLRGHINGEGFGDMGTVPVFYPGFVPVNEEAAKKFGDLWSVGDLPADLGIGYMDMVEKCSILYIMGANPMMSAPDITRVKGLLENKDLVVVQDLFMTETAELADIVLPAQTWAEEEGTVTGTDRRVQFMNKAVEAQGEAKPDWMPFCELAKLMSYEDKFTFGSAEDIFEEIRKVIPTYTGISYERLKKAGGIQWPCPSEDHPGTDTMFADGKFKTPDGLGHFQVVEHKPPAEPVDKEYPFALCTGRILFHYHTGVMTRKTERLNFEVSEAVVEINPEDAKEEGIEDGAVVVVKSRRGELRPVAKVTDGMPKGMLFMPWHFAECAGNVLTGPSAGPPSKMPEYKYVAVEIEKGGE